MFYFKQKFLNVKKEITRYFNSFETRWFLIGANQSGIKRLNLDMFRSNAKEQCHSNVNQSLISPIKKNKFSIVTHLWQLVDLILWVSMHNTQNQLSHTQFEILLLLNRAEW